MAPLKFVLPERDFARQVQVVMLKSLRRHPFTSASKGAGGTLLAPRRRDPCRLRTSRPNAATCLPVQTSFMAASNQTSLTPSPGRRYGSACPLPSLRFGRACVASLHCRRLTPNFVPHWSSHSRFVVRWLSWHHQEFRAGLLAPNIQDDPICASLCYKCRHRFVSDLA